MDNSVVVFGGQGLGQVEREKGGYMVREGDLSLGDEHTIQYTDGCILILYARNLYNVLTNVTPISSI